jgi:ClpP class serine protease
MAVFLPLMMQNLFNTPLALSQRKAEMIVAALAGRLDIQSLTTETMRYDSRALRNMGERGLVEAQLDRQLRASRQLTVPEGPMMTDDWYGERPYRLSSNGIAMIEVLGTLTRTWGTDPYSGTTGYDGIWTKLAFAMDDAACKGVWLKINSGGGAVDGLFDLSDAIFKCSARNGGKPICAFAGDYAYSAAYALGAPADYFYAPKLGGVGSIGCLAIFIDLTQAMEEHGIEAVIFRSEERKAIGIGGMESLDKEEVDHIQAQIELAGDHFKERVATYRGIPISKVSQTKGTDYKAEEAMAIGLIDGIVSEQDAWVEFGRAIAA